MKKQEFLNSIKDIIKDKIFITNGLAELDKEISNNCWSISVDEETALNLSANDIEDFLKKVKENRKNQLANSNSTQDLQYYSWYDQQAFQFRFNLININHPNLPFGAKIKTVKKEEEIIKLLLHNNLEDYLEPLPVYKEVIKNETITHR